MHTLSVLTELEMTYEQRKQFFENLKILVKSEYEEIFRILKKNKEEYTENSNGIFFDMLGLTTETFTEIKVFMELCKNQRTDESERVKEMDCLRDETKPC